MAIGTNAKTTYTAAANDRDVSAIVTNIAPSDSPFYSMIGSNSAVARLKENVNDTLDAADATNALVEGDIFANEALLARTFETNYTQIFKKVLEVSETQETVDKYGGVKSEVTYQSSKKFKELATDIEKAFIQGTSASGTTAAARKLSGLIQKCTTNTATAATNAALWTGTAEANLNDFEDLLNDLFDQMWTTGERADTVLVGGDRKRRISKLSTKVTRNIDAEKKTQILSINMYEGDFGMVNIILDRYVPDVNILAVSLDKFKTAYLRRFKQVKLAKTHDSTRIAIVGELTLDVKTEKAIGKITAS